MLTVELYAHSVLNSSLLNILLSIRTFLTITRAFSYISNNFSFNLIISSL